MAFWNRKRRKKEPEDLEEEREPLDSMLPTGEEEIPAAKVSDEVHGGDADGKETSSKRLSDEQLAREHVVPVGRAEQKQFFRDCCETIAESDRQIARARLEYGQVTEYLTDIQKIDRIEGDDRERMLELCRRIKNLLQERNQYKNRTVTITDRQLRRFDQYQEDLIDEIKKMYHNEMYQKAIESDMKHLEAEKAYIRSVQQESMKKQETLKGIAKGLTALIVSLIVLLILLYFNLDANMTYPYIGTLLLAAISAAVIFAESNKNRYEIALSGRKMTKAIGLLNGTKIKYINNTSVYDYNREKYGVKNAEDFERLWGEYCKAKEYERKFRENTEMLNRSNESLQELLTEYEVADPEVWLVQVYAILDNREMVEIRHDLNQRRQKLREQIQYNTETKEDYMGRMNEILRQNPAWREELEGIMRG